MDKKTAKEYLRGKLESYLSDKGINTSKTFRCINPEHEDRHPSMSKVNNRCMCISCGAKYDIFDAICIFEGISSFSEAFDFACKYYNVTIDVEQNRKSNTDPVKEKISTPADPVEEKTDFTSFYLQANKDLNKTDYHRGISEDTLNRFKVGYVENWKHPKAPNAPGSPRLIIPVTQYSHIARDTRKELTADQEAYKKQKVKGCNNPIWIFNRKALETSNKPIIIVEGEIDALSIVDVGGEAVALGSLAYIPQFLEYIKTHKPKQPLIISLDNENNDNIRKREDKLLTGLKEQGITCYKYNISGSYKDANDFLNANKEEFTAEVLKMSSEEEIKRTIYLKYSTENYINDFLNGIKDRANTSFIPTGFKNLDQILEGGLYQGLYIIGAISSLGKTTITLQIADQIARSGEDVIIFTLEMARAELMAKSISRHTLIEALDTGIDIQNAKTTRGITTYKRYQYYTDLEKKLIKTAVTNYSNYSNHLFIFEGIGDIGVKQIREAIERHISFTGKRPVVIIDYLQILAPADIRASDKQNTDKNVIELRRISRDFKIPLLAISSLNRASYKDKVTMEAFKESGAIEYTSDVLIGLQLSGVGNNNFDVDKAKAENPRKVELIILKNREAATGKHIQFDYYTPFNYFEERKETAIRKTTKII